jgi:hypothetical protein
MWDTRMSTDHRGLPVNANDSMMQRSHRPAPQATIKAHHPSTLPPSPLRNPQSKEHGARWHQSISPTTLARQFLSVLTTLLRI